MCYMYFITSTELNRYLSHGLIYVYHFEYTSYHYEYIWWFAFFSLLMIILTITNYNKTPQIVTYVHTLGMYLSCHHKTPFDSGIYWSCCGFNGLTHWGRMTHICVGNLTIIGSDNGLSPGRRQAIIWTNTGILSIGPLGTNFSEI